MPQALPPGVASRSAALDLLRLTQKGHTLDVALDLCRSFGALEGSDRGFARAIASTTLRRRGTLDEVLASYLREPLKPKQEHLRNILRITAAQICLMGTESHAAAWSAVELAKLRAETAPYKGLVNAVARRMTESGADKAANVPLRADTPGWLWRALARAYGAKTAGAIARAHRQEPPLDLSLRDPSDAPDFPEELSPRTIGVRTVRMASTRVDSLPGFAEGRFWVQDVAASLPAHLLSVTKGQRVYDLCAAPGGKTMQLAADGGEVFAIDLPSYRIVRLNENLERTGLRAVVIEEDLMHWSPPNLADAVLLDAPCTATGTVRRNPDLLWTGREAALPGLTGLQAKMLDKAANLLREGGMMVYSVCSLLPQEGEKQIEAFLARRKDMERVPVQPDEAANLPIIDANGDLRCLPHKFPGEGGMDGFFVSRLRKKPSAG